MKIVIKVGTQSILSNDGTPLESVMSSLVEQIVSLQENNHRVVLVSSGAVGSGRQVARELLGREYGSSLGEKQVLASLGQHELMHVYAKMFKAHRILASQLLLTRQDFHTRQHYLNIARLLHEILEHRNIVPVINENDSVAIEELMFTDNDELAGLIAAQINADKLIILSNVDGVYSSAPGEPGAQVIPLIDPEKNWPKISTAKSGQGRGGMISKLNTARKMSILGITTHIANIDQPRVIMRIVNQEEIGTSIVPGKKKSNIKRWIAFNPGKQSGSIVLEARLYAKLKENKHVISLLPVGIEKCSGEFKKGDLVEITGPEGQKTGLGIALYDIDKLRGYLGQKNKPVFIHYDYLHIF